MQRGLGRRSPWIRRGGHPDSDLHITIVRQKRTSGDYPAWGSTGRPVLRRPRQSLPITTQRSSALRRPTSLRAQHAIRIQLCRPSVSRTPGRLHFRDRRYARRSRTPATAWQLDLVSSHFPRHSKLTKPEVYDVWKHARISNQRTAFTRSWLPGHSPVGEEYVDVLALAQRHILPTAATDTAVRLQTLP